MALRKAVIPEHAKAWPAQPDSLHKQRHGGNRRLLRFKDASDCTRNDAQQRDVLQCL